MTALEILEAFVNDEAGEYRGQLIEEVISYMNLGMHDEWDIGLLEGIKEGFGGEELQIAARSALSLARFYENDS